MFVIKQATHLGLAARAATLHNTNKLMVLCKTLIQAMHSMNQRLHATRWCVEHQSDEGVGQASVLHAVYTLPDLLHVHRS